MMPVKDTEGFAGAASGVTAAASGAFLCFSISSHAFALTSISKTSAFSYTKSVKLDFPVFFGLYKIVPNDVRDALFARTLTAIPLAAKKLNIILARVAADGCIQAEMAVAITKPVAWSPKIAVVSHISAKRFSA